MIYQGVKEFREVIEVKAECTVGVVLDTDKVRHKKYK